MPELPEVESVRVGLLPLIGQPVHAVAVRRRDVVRSRTGARRGVLDLSHLLVGDRLAALDRRGKQLALIGGSGRIVLMHLGMSGQVLVTAQDPGPGDHRHVAWSVGKASMTFRDPRRFGGVWLLPDRAALDARWEALGVDGLSVTGADLAAALGGSSRPVKAGLLDQAAVAGVGNIYADESLFEAGIDPARACRSLSETEWSRLGEAVRAVLARAVRAGGSTLRDYRRPDGSSGQAVAGHRVYARAGRPCPVCGGPIAGTVLAQRSTCWCPACQT